MTRATVIDGSIASIVFAGVFGLRWTTLDFDNDYFMHVAWAAEMLRGGRPVLDFVEPGFILQTVVSYLGFRAGGYQLFWEGVVACALIAASATFLYLTCRRVGIPRGWALLAVVLAVASYPRLYAYPKALVYPAALWALTVYGRRPTWRSLLLLSVVTAIAFLFRHDHGVWIGAAATAGLLLYHRDDLPAGIRTVAAYGFAAMLVVFPWLGWVAASGQAAQYVGFLTGQSRGLVTNRIVPDRPFEIDTSMPLLTLAPVDFPLVGIRWADDTPGDERRERERRYGLQPLSEPDRYRLMDIDSANVRALVQDPVVEDTSGIDRSTLRVPSGMFPWLHLRLQQYLPPVRARILPGLVRRSNAQAWLTYVTFLLPWIVLAAAPVSLALAGLSRTFGPVFPSLILPAALLSVITYQMLVRGSPDSRLGDVAPVTALLLAWVTWRAWQVERWPRLVLGPTVTVLFITTTSAAVSYGQALDRLADAGVDGPTNVVRRVRDVGARYAARPLDVFAPPASAGLPGLSRWLHECTANRDRVSIIGFEPQIFVLSERSFAGGMVFYDLAWASTERDQRLTIDRWARQSVPVVLAIGSEWGAFSSDYARIRAWIDERYQVERRSAFGGNKEVTVLRQRSRPVMGLHHATGLPCFTGQQAR